MAEAGMTGETPKPMGVVDRVKGKLREMFTVEGRAEAMADAQMKRAEAQMNLVLAEAPPEKRAEAMKMLEAKRPELIGANMPEAKNTLVRDAVIGATTMGAVAVGFGVGYAKRDKIINTVFSMGIPTIKGDQRSIAAKETLTRMRKANFVESIRKATDPVAGFMKAMSDKWAGLFKNRKPSNLIDALSGAIKLDALDALDTAAPATKEFLKKSLEPGVFNNSELQNTEGESFAELLLQKAQEFGRWVPIVTAKGQEPYGFGDDREGVGGLMKNGLVTMKELTDGKKLFIPTEKFVDFVKRHVEKAEGA